MDKGTSSVMTSYKIIIVDDHPLFRGALRQTLSGSIDDLQVFEAGSLDELLKALDTKTETWAGQIMPPAPVSVTILTFFSLS